MADISSNKINPCFYKGFFPVLIAIKQYGVYLNVAIAILNPEC